MKGLSIGQMARLNGPSEQVLRLYNKAGPSSPVCQDVENGYHCYDIHQSAQLDMIQHTEALGMSLKGIEGQLTHFELDMFKTTLHRSLEGLELGSKELIYQRRAMKRAFGSYEWYENAPPDETIVLEYISGRLTYMTDSGVNFYDYDIDVCEKILRNLKENLIVNQLSPIYFYNAGTVMCRKYLMEGKYYSTEIFVLVDRSFAEDGLIAETPASTYLYTYCNSFEKEEEYMGRLMEEIRAGDYQVTGDHICEVVAEVPMDMQEGGMFPRL